MGHTRTSGIGGGTQPKSMFTTIHAFSKVGDISSIDLLDHLDLKRRNFRNKSVGVFHHAPELVHMGWTGQ